MKLIPIKDRMVHKPKKRIDFYPENFEKPRENILDAIEGRYYEKLIEVAARETVRSKDLLLAPIDSVTLEDCLVQPSWPSTDI
jgi:hypothetical protein